MWILIFILWLIFGSLGSVIMTRFADGVTKEKLRGFFFGRSECPHCHHALKAKNLIPIISYLVQWGKCVYCKKKISRIYPVLELISAGIFLLTYFLLKDFWTPILIFWLLTNQLLVLLLVYDMKEYELHIVGWLLLATVGILANIFLPVGNLRYAFLTTLLFGWFFTCIYFFGKRYANMRFNQPEGFGEGDIYLAVSIWILMPIILSLHKLSFSRMTMINILILFILMSSIIGLIRTVLHYLLNCKLHIENWKRKEYSQSSILHSQCKVIPFFPAMIIAFRILAWKLPYFITIIFW